MTEKVLPPPLPGEENNANVAVPARNDLHQQEVDEQDEDEDFEEERGGASRLIESVIAIAIAYVGGWKITWGATIWRTKKALVMNDHGLLMRINDLYYGLGMTDRFFDAPFISWLCLIPLFAALGFRGFVFGQGR
ncbi:hypothetical protein [Stenotrophomonas sp. YIM B06876]|uniref:hypothetical protein n=1 Tax=Stenotrophomonas sp. YIM B06876 TaxID=3060211 RepID=UPI00273853A9|nr:hypothetical protein [Stenotrophomonas sp. YIM B06876]